MSRGSRALLACAGYVLLALATTWPLARHFGSALTGDVAGDTGVYVWNLWVFHHEIAAHGRLPFSTDHVLAYGHPTDFTLHNYTPAVDAAAAPFIGALGLVPTFNLMLIVIVAAAGAATSALARQSGLSPGFAWVAGALVAASPAIVARETAHFSLVAAAPLPVFLWALRRTLDEPSAGRGILVGAIVAWASYSDAYYGIYCTLMGLFVLVWRGLVLDWRRGAGQGVRTVTRVLDLLLIGLAAVIAWRLVSGSAVLRAGPIAVSMRSLYTPVLALTVLAIARLWAVRRPVVRLASPGLDLRRLWLPGAAAVAACVVLMAPMLAGLAWRAAHGELPGTPIFWRSSPRGVDLLAYLVPNPSHPLFGAHTATWLMPDRPDAFPEYVAAFSLVALALIAIAAWRRALPEFWLAFTAVFAALSLGPFVYVGGALTYVPGPWALLRYVPAIEMARSPSRFAIVAALGLSILTAYALRDLLGRVPRHRSGWAIVLGAALVFEVLPAPRYLYPAAVPPVYARIAAAPDERGRVLELPTGIRDGTSSVGDFSPASQYYQTGHGHPLIGGYLSRVPPAQREAALELPFYGALLRLSEHQAIDDEARADAVEAGDWFLRRTCVGFVVVDRQRATPELVSLAQQALDLVPSYEDRTHVLLTPRDPPPCEGAGVVGIRDSGLRD
jgi:hypothetical protein